MNERTNEQTKNEQTKERKKHTYTFILLSISLPIYYIPATETDAYSPSRDQPSGPPVLGPSGAPTLQRAACTAGDDPSPGARLETVSAALIHKNM